MDSPWHILVVEDTLIAQVFIKQQLLKHGCVVDTANDGEAAIRKTLFTPYDVILMDIGLGVGPDGFTVAAEIKKQSRINRTTPIMAVSAHGEPEYHEKAITVGMLAYFYKPFTPQDATTLVDYLKKTRRKSSLPVG